MIGLSIGNQSQLQVFPHLRSLKRFFSRTSYLFSLPALTYSKQLLLQYLARFLLDLFLNTATPANKRGNFSTQYIPRDNLNQNRSALFLDYSGQFCIGAKQVAPDSKDQWSSFGECATLSQG